MRTQHFVILAFIAIAIASVAMWLTRPSAIPMHPGDVIFAPKEEQNSIPGNVDEPAVAPAKQTPPSKANVVEEELEKPLNLELEKATPVISDQPNDIASKLRDDQTVSLNFPNDRVTKKKIPKVKLFDPEYGTRGFSARRWMSDNLGLEAGVGLTDGEKLRERDAAAGVGVVFSFD